MKKKTKFHRLVTTHKNEQGYKRSTIRPRCTKIPPKNTKQNSIHWPRYTKIKKKTKFHRPDMMQKNTKKKRKKNQTDFDGLAMIQKNKEENKIPQSGHTAQERIHVNGRARGAHNTFRFTIHSLAGEEDSDRAMQPMACSAIIERRVTPRGGNPFDR